MRQLLDGQYKGRIDTASWRDSKNFDALTKLANDPKTPATLFMPGSAEAWQVVASYYCLTMEEWLSAIASNPSLAASYLSSFVILKKLHSSDFYDGMPLKSLQNSPGPHETYKLARKNM